MTKMVDSVKGIVRMANGTHREAYCNTYRNTIFSNDGSFAHVEVSRIEFLLDTAAGKSNTWRKASSKQAETFSPLDGRTVFEAIEQAHQAARI
jgi:hypothetical protein